MPSARLAFCSTSSTVVPRLWMSSTTSKILSTMIGLRPIDGSSSITTFGLALARTPLPLGHQPPARRGHLLFGPAHRAGELVPTLLEAREDREHIVDAGVDFLV